MTKHVFAKLRHNVNMGAYNLSDIVADGRGEHGGDFRTIQAIVAFEPIQQTCGGVLQGLVERTADAGKHDVFVVLSPGLIQQLIADEVNGKFNVHGSFKALTGDFSVGLQSVAVSYRK